MTVKDTASKTEQKAYQKKIQAKVKQWEADIAKLQAIAADADEDAQDFYQENIHKIQTLKHELQSKAKRLVDSSDEAWNDLKQGVDQSASSLGQSIKLALSRFRI